MPACYTKVVISNKFVEVYTQSVPPIQPNKSLGGRKKSIYSKPEENPTNLQISINRARKKIHRLIECNFNNDYIFLTLTFKETLAIDITSYDQCHKAFCDFKKRLSYYLTKNHMPSFKYIGITEFHDKNRNGTIHFHLICNLTFISRDILQILWTHGIIHTSKNNSDYSNNKKIAYYLHKGINDPRLTGKKKYFCSQGLQKPISITLDNPDDFFDSLDQIGITPLDTKTYYSNLYGDIQYQTYYLNKAKELLNYVQEL
ncbi:hypothetical protein QCQ60_004516 [Bacillus cereus]|nr:hypothetical protein [Bacillus cereus]